MSVQYQKVKSVAKQITPRSQALTNLVLSTMRKASQVVGATLGPGGCAVLIERQEHDLPPLITKDGVTVFRHLGFDDAAAQCVMEAARDAAVRTATEAGDGTTTATILAEAIVRRTSEFVHTNPRMSPQKVVRRLERAFSEVIEPTIRSCSMKPLANDRDVLHAVAKISANGDVALADKVLECFELVGDEGNVTIAEQSGPSAYEVEKIDGFPIGIGYEDSCAKFYAKFINDPANQRCVLDKPIFLIYDGRISEFQALTFILEEVGRQWQAEVLNRHNVVVVATGFSDTVLGQLAVNFEHPQTINVVPLVAPPSPLPNGQRHFLEDLACVVGARVLDPLNYPLERATMEDLGTGEDLMQFESYRYRSTIVGHDDEEEIFLRSDQIKANIANAVSDLDRIILQERLAKLTGGIAKLKVIGASNGELKEKRDRAEDAVCAVRGTLKHGCLPGGGWMLLKLMAVLKDEHDPVITGVLIPALFEPVARLLSNCGLNEEDIQKVLAPVIVSTTAHSGPVVYDALEDKHVDPYKGGVLDSTPAVLEAIRNSISIAALLGTLGGTVVFKRDVALERSEAAETAAWLRDADSNPANERA